MALFGPPQSTNNWYGILKKFFKVEVDEIFLTDIPGKKCVNSRWGTHHEWRIENGMNISVNHLEKESTEYPLINITYSLYETEMFRKFERYLNNYTFGTYEQVDSLIKETCQVLKESNSEVMQKTNCKQRPTSAFCGNAKIMTFEPAISFFPLPEYKNKEEMDQKLNFLFD